MFKNKVKQELNQMEQELLDAKNTIVNLRYELAHKKTVEKDLEAVEKELEVLKKKVREQTTADLLLNALEAAGIIKPAKKKEPGYYLSRDAKLQAQLAKCNGYLSGGPLYGFGSVLGGIGSLLG